MRSNTRHDLGLDGAVNWDYYSIPPGTDYQTELEDQGSDGRVMARNYRYGAHTHNWSKQGYCGVCGEKHPYPWLFKTSRKRTNP